MMEHNVLLATLQAQINSSIHQVRVFLPAQQVFMEISVLYVNNAQLQWNVEAALITQRHLKSNVQVVRIF